MTNKELSYYEDAVTHEENIISIIKALEDAVSDPDIMTYIGGELETHKKIKSKLVKRLKEAINE